jgi:hypothetical protein
MATEGPDDLEPTEQTPAVTPTGQVAAASSSAGGGGAKRDRRRFVWILLGVFAVGILAGGLIVWLTHDNSKSNPVAVADAGASATTVPVTSATVAPTTADIGGGGGGGGGARPTRPPQTQPTTPETSAPPIKIDSFDGGVDGGCSTVPPVSGESSTVPAPNPQVFLTWSTTNATSVDLSVDGAPAFQRNIRSSGTKTLPFACPGPHTYTITAHGPNGTTVTKSKTFSAP